MLSFPTKWVIIGCREQLLFLNLDGYLSCHSWAKLDIYDHEMVYWNGDLSLKHDLYQNQHFYISYWVGFKTNIMMCPAMYFLTFKCTTPQEIPWLFPNQFLFSWLLISRCYCIYIYPRKCMCPHEVYIKPYPKCQSL